LSGRDCIISSSFQLSVFSSKFSSHELGFFRPAR
jgi:hypothetical protein